MYHQLNICVKELTGSENQNIGIWTIKINSQWFHLWSWRYRYRTFHDEYKNNIVSIEVKQTVKFISKSGKRNWKYGQNPPWNINITARPTLKWC